MKDKTLTLVLTGGGSGGHITPLLSVAQELKKQQPNCCLIYIGSKGDQFGDVAASGVFDKYYSVRAGKFRRYYGQNILLRVLDLKTLVLNIRDFFYVFAGIWQSWRLLGKLKPDAILVKGGFVGVPVGYAGHLRHIPIVTHDSDAVAGLANRIVGRWAKFHATGMPAKFYNYSKATVRYVGIPLSSEFSRVSPAQQAKSKEELDILPKSPILLVVGGSLGAKSINENIVEISPELFIANEDLRIIHITGRRHEEDVKKAYSKILDSAKINHVQVLGFVTDLYKYTAAADVIVARAGATALAEFAAQAKACVIIPNPFLTGGHQTSNAEQLSKLGAIKVVEYGAEASVLLKAISELFISKQAREDLSRALGATAKPDAGAELAKLLVETAEEKESVAKK